MYPTTIGEPNWTWGSTDGPIDLNAIAGGPTGLKGLFAKLKGSNLAADAVNHPFMYGGIAGLGAANVAGLVNDNKVAGQLGGAAVGGLGSLAAHGLLGMSGAPLAILPLAGGLVGSVIDARRKSNELTQQFYAEHPEYNELNNEFGNSMDEFSNYIRQNRYR